MPTLVSSSRVLPLSRSYVAISHHQGQDGHQLPCKPFSHLRLVLLCQLSPSLETFAVSCQKHGVESCTVADHEHHLVKLCRRCSIVVLQDRGRLGSALPPSQHHASASPAWSVQTWYRCTSVLLEHSAPVPPSFLCTRESHLASPRVHSDPVTCDPRSGDSRTSFLSVASSFAACCLLCANSFCSSGFCLVKTSSAVELLMHCSHGIFCHLEVWGTRCLPVDSD